MPAGGGPDYHNSFFLLFILYILLEMRKCLKYLCSRLELYVPQLDEFLCLAPNYSTEFWSSILYGKTV
jgi:hypothetical protein